MGLLGLRRKTDWTVLLFIVGYHVALLIGLPFYFTFHPPGLALVLISVALLFLTEIGIGAAYHRYYAHRCYRLGRPAEAVLLFLATLATQGTALRWSFEHRMHHADTDGEGDPHPITRGFWYAHVLWLFERPRPIDESMVQDLLANPLVRFQARYGHVASFVSNGLVALLVGLAVGDILGAFVLAWFTRMAVSHHLTWFINSLAHTWGARTYSREHSAVDNFFVALFTVGEGYHNFHHAFPGDYRNGHRWYHFDPTKWTVWTLSKLGQASDLRRTSSVGIRKRLLIEDRRLLSERLRDSVDAAGADVRRRVEALAERMLESLRTEGVIAERMRSLRAARRKDRTARQRFDELRAEWREARRRFRRDLREWNRLCGDVLSTAATA